MRKLTSILCLTIAVLIGNVGFSWGQSIPNLSALDYETRSSIQIACVNEKLRGPAPYARCINSQLASIGMSPGSNSQPRYVMPSPPTRRDRQPRAFSRKPPKPTQRKRIDPNKIVSASSGTGFAVSSSGHVITNYHVIQGCQTVKIHYKGKSIRASLVTFDPKNDLALLKGDFRPSTVLSLSNGTPELLQDIYVAGYPFGRRISTGVKVTKGIISSLTGIGNNFSQMQIDAAIQPGNSGGPILDDKGNVVGVAVAKLDYRNILKNFGVIPEDTNFGIKTNVVRNILESSGVSLSNASGSSISKSKLGKMISDGTYYLSCWMTMAQIEKLKSRKVIFQNLK